ncbi:hypothetical protein [Alteribacillus iranensis]|uniref:Uncharacterized protein n=1 Tax=Alteribacillus iranensis TaxID=930128 RepID=A0A1I2BM87_9BACI|nr:hypothetical protein [Alteribacillus iranensis]SFE57332.1 hypothetical protein SAMN05192532_102399 [Alteribacillus iranensis]
MFQLPVETFWLIVPWPFIWLAFGIVMYVVNKRDDKREEAYENNAKKVN